jgi:hypothetical protein
LAAGDLDVDASLATARTELHVVSQKLLSARFLSFTSIAAQRSALSTREPGARKAELFHVPIASRESLGLGAPGSQSASSHAGSNPGESMRGSNFRSPDTAPKRDGPVAIRDDGRPNLGERAARGAREMVVRLRTDSQRNALRFGAEAPALRSCGLFRSDLLHLDSERNTARRRPQGEGRTTPQSRSRRPPFDNVQWSARASLSPGRNSTDS